MSVRAKRGTRAQINAAAAASGLKLGEMMYLTDENRFAVATATNTLVLLDALPAFATKAQAEAGLAEGVIMDSLRTKQAISAQVPKPQMQIIGAPVVVSSPVAIIQWTGLTIDEFYIKMAGISHNNASNTTLRLGFSTNNGTTWHDADSLLAAQAPSALVHMAVTGVGLLSGYVVANAGAGFAPDAPPTVTAFQETNARGTRAHLAGPINALRLTYAAGSIDAGTITLKGR